MNAKQIMEQYQTKLITKPEALQALESIEVNAAYDRDYSDSFDEYRRFQSIISDCQRFAACIRRSY